MIWSSETNMNFKTIAIIKIEYEVGLAELDEIFVQRMTVDEKKWTSELSQKYPNESIITKENKVTDFLISDEETTEEIKKMLDRVKVNYKISDATNEYISNSKLLSLTFKDDISNFIKDNSTIDEILDRINEVGFENISILEKKFLEIYDGDGHKNTRENTN